MRLESIRWPHCGTTKAGRFEVWALPRDQAPQNPGQCFREEKNAMLHLEHSSCLVTQRLPIPRRPAWSTCFLSELLVKILDVLPDSGPQLIEMGRRASVWGRFMVEVSSPPLASALRSEERRVGKECRSRWS